MNKVYGKADACSRLRDLISEAIFCPAVSEGLQRALSRAAYDLINTEHPSSEAAKFAERVSLALEDH